MKAITFLFVSATLLTVQSCGRSLDKPLYLNCTGEIDRGIIDKSTLRNSVELVNSNVTLTIDKKLIDMKGDGTQLEFMSVKTVCSDTDEIKFDSNRCEDSAKQIDRLMTTYQNNQDKVLEVKKYEDHHKVFGTYNKISKTLYIEAEDSLCYGSNKTKLNSCGTYTVGKYKCESVEIK